MDWNAIWLLVMGVGLIAVVGVFVWAAVMRMTGRRSRFDHFAETLVRAQGAAIYPPSLRPDPEPPVIEEIEDSRAARIGSETPAEGAENPSTE